MVVTVTVVVVVTVIVIVIVVVIVVVPDRAPGAARRRIGATLRFEWRLQRR